MIEIRFYLYDGPQQLLLLDKAVGITKKKIQFQMQGPN